jgi:hypothetical protein
MKEYSTVQERDAFDERIFEIVQEYLEDGNNESNMGLSINPQTLEFVLVSRENNSEKWDFHPIDGLIRLNENNTGNEPDCDATYELASTYCFVK